MYRPRSAPTCKIFIGQLPRTFGEEAIAGLLAQYGNVLEVQLMHRSGGSSKCAAFAVFSTQREAEAAVFALHNNVTLKPAVNPLQVHIVMPKGGTSVTVSSVPLGLHHSVLLNAFQRFGALVHGSTIMTDAHNESGEVIIEFVDEMASESALILNGKSLLPNTPPVVVKKTPPATAMHMVHDPYSFVGFSHVPSSRSSSTIVSQISLDFSSVSFCSSLPSSPISLSVSSAQSAPRSSVGSPNLTPISTPPRTPSPIHH
jgi:hypothetical protein